MSGMKKCSITGAAVVIVQMLLTSMMHSPPLAIPLISKKGQGWGLRYGRGWLTREKRVIDSLIRARS